MLVEGSYVSAAFDVSGCGTVLFQSTGSPPVCAFGRHCLARFERAACAALLVFIGSGGPVSIVDKIG